MKFTDLPEDILELVYKQVFCNCLEEIKRERSEKWERNWRNHKLELEEGKWKMIWNGNDDSHLLIRIVELRDIAD